jgi:23S rRNA pseudoU1915 N3-methylase RlmH
MDALITGAATLGGAVVSAGAAAAATRWSLNKKHRLDAKEQQARLARDVATRFLNAVTDIDTKRMDRMKSNTIASAERAEALKQALPELLRAAKLDPKGAARMAQELAKTLNPTQSSSHQVRAVGDAMACLEAIKPLMAEMRLIFPRGLVTRADEVAMKSIAVSIFSEVPEILKASLPKEAFDNVPDLTQLSADRDAAIKAFQNALRESFDLDLLTE